MVCEQCSNKDLQCHLCDEYSHYSPLIEGESIFVPYSQIFYNPKSYAHCDYCGAIQLTQNLEAASISEFDFKIRCKKGFGCQR